MTSSALRERGVLIIAGEPSADRIAAMVTSELSARGIRTWGLAGPACKSAGMTVLADIAKLGAMGIGDVIREAPELMQALALLRRRVQKEPPETAILVSTTELNTYVGRWLRSLGVRVLWCVAPQAWAWRPSRFQTLKRSLDSLAVILPFEEALWRRAGVEAYYVGHPALDSIARAPSRAEARSMLGLPSEAGATLAVLPGSRAGEVRRLAKPLCEAAATLRDEGAIEAARVLVAPWLSESPRAIVHREAERAGLPVVSSPFNSESDSSNADAGAAGLLSAFDLSFCASGTASLEAALAGAIPVVTYRMEPLSFQIARLLVKTPHIALPNIILGRRAFPELLQDDVTTSQVAAAGRAMLKRLSEGQPLAAELRERLSRDLAQTAGATFGARVAGLLLRENPLGNCGRGSDQGGLGGSAARPRGPPNDNCERRGRSPLTGSRPCRRATLLDGLTRAVASARQRTEEDDIP